VLLLCPLSLPLAAWSAGGWGRALSRIRAVEWLACAVAALGVVVYAVARPVEVTPVEVSHALLLHGLFVFIVSARHGLLGPGEARAERVGDATRAAAPCLLRQLADAERRSGTDLGPLRFYFPPDRFASVREALEAEGTYDACPHLRADDRGFLPARLLVVCFMLKMIVADDADPSSGRMRSSWAERGARWSLAATVACLPIIIRGACTSAPLGATLASALTTLSFAFVVFVHLNYSVSKSIAAEGVAFFRRRAHVLRQFSALLEGKPAAGAPATEGGGKAQAVTPALLSAGGSHTGLHAIDMLSARNLTTWFWARDAFEFWGADTHRRIQVYNGANLAVAAAAAGLIVFESLSGVTADPYLSTLAAFYAVCSVAVIAACVYHGYASNLEGRLNLLALLRAKLRLGACVAHAHARARDRVLDLI
jgi:hypothetical protein